jgi:hypothetical protein
VLPGIEIDSTDIDCGQNTTFQHRRSNATITYCRQCGGAEAVADACALNPECVGFTMEVKEGNETCGYLKSAVLKQAQYGAAQGTLYCRDSQPDCAGGCDLSDVTSKI